MRRPVQIALAVALVTVVSVIAWQVLRTCRERQPIYGGKPLTLWLRTYSPSSSSGLHSPEWNAAMTLCDTWERIVFPSCCG